MLRWAQNASLTIWLQSAVAAQHSDSPNAHSICCFLFAKYLPVANKDCAVTSVCLPIPMLAAGQWLAQQPGPSPIGYLFHC
jgi:hypothetical protein